MTQAHIGSILPIKNRVLAADEHTAFLAHYDLNENDVLKGTKPIGSTSAFSFNGTNYIQVPNPLKNKSSFAISFWIKHNSPSAWSNVFTFDTGDNSNAPRIEWDGAGNYRWYGTGAIVSGDVMFTHDGSQWDHIVITCDGINTSCYKNGVVTYSSTKVSSNLPNCTYINVGKRVTNGNWKGSMYNVALYDRSLSAGEIKSIMSNTHPERGLVGYWTLTESVGKAMQDLSPNHDDGTVVGEVLWSNGNLVFTIREQEGKFGGGIAIEEGTTNLQTSGLVGMNGITCTLVGEENGYQKYALSGTWNSGTYPYSMNLGSHAYKIGVSYSMSCHLYTNVPEKFASSSYGTFGVINIVNDAALSGKRQATREGTYSAREDYIHSKDMGNTAYLITQPVANGTVFDPKTDFMYVKDIQLEEKSFATSYVEEARGTGSISYDLSAMGVDPLGDWTISGWFKRHKNVTGWASVFGIGNYYAAEQSEFTIWTNHSGRLYAHTHDNKTGGGSALFTANAGEMEDWFFVAATHTKKTNEFNIYAWTKDRYAKTSFVDVMQYPMEPTLYIGRSSSSSHMFNGIIDEIRIDKVTRTEEEITAWYESNSPFWPRGIYRKSY
jgi:hypothetical protein